MMEVMSVEGSPSPTIASTNAVNRSFSDLHAPTWFMLLSANISARTLLFHPLQLAVARKRMTRENTTPSVWSLLQAAFRGGEQRFGGGGGAYDFGRGGLRGCYRGVGVALTCNLVGEMSYLYTLEVLKERITDPATADASSSDSTFSADSSAAAVSAMCGDFVALTLVTPLVIVCNRQMTAAYGMTASNRYQGSFATLREVWSQGVAMADNTRSATPSSSSSRLSVWRRSARMMGSGIQGMYQGYTAGLLRLPSSGCWWGLYTKLKEGLYTVCSPHLSRWEQERQAAALTDPHRALSSDGRNPPRWWQQNLLLSPTDNPLLNVSAGIIASVVTTILMNPIAVIQTRQQSLPASYWAERLRRSETHRRWSLSPLRGVHLVAADLWRKEGLAGFFKGASANVSVAVLDGIIFTLLFELTKLGSDVQFLQHAHTASSEAN